MKVFVLSMPAKMPLHARPAAELVRLARLYESEVVLSFNGEAVNGKSLMGVLSLGVTGGSKITFTVLGKDEAHAAEALKALLLTFKD